MKRSITAIDILVVLFIVFAIGLVLYINKWADNTTATLPDVPQSQQTVKDWQALLDADATAESDKPHKIQ